MNRQELEEMLIEIMRLEDAEADLARREAATDALITACLAFLDAHESEVDEDTVNFTDDDVDELVENAGDVIGSADDYAHDAAEVIENRYQHLLGA